MSEIACDKQNQPFSGLTNASTTSNVCEMSEIACDQQKQPFSGLTNASTSSVYISDLQFPCPACDKVYLSRSAMRQHVKKHHPAEFDSLLPPRQVNKTSSLSFSDLEDFPCPACDRVYLSRKAMRQHVKEHHPAKLDSLPPPRQVNNTSSVSFSDLPHFPCPACSKVYLSREAMKRHVKKHHPAKLDSLPPPRQVKKIFNFTCKDCGHNFTKESNFNYHVKKKHSLNGVISRVVKCPVCTHSIERKKYFSHCERVHNIQVESEEKHFLSYEEFISWKKNEEKRTKSSFIRSSLSKVKTGAKKSFSCHRSGFYKPTGEGHRHLKSVGSCKINGYCPAAIVLTISNESNNFLVKYIKTHVGHENDIGHLRLPHEQRLAIAEKMKSKIPFDNILEDVRSSMDPSIPERINVLRRQDLRNIKRSKLTLNGTENNLSVVGVNGTEVIKQINKDDLTNLQSEEPISNCVEERKIHILEDVRSSITSNIPERINVLHKQDLRNIKRSKLTLKEKNVAHGTENNLSVVGVNGTEVIKKINKDDLTNLRSEEPISNCVEERKKIMKGDIINVIHSLKSLEEVEALEKILALAKPTLEAMRNSV